METNESIRLRTEPGSSKNILVKIKQEFDTIDFLSLKITQDEAYRNFCSDYGVVAGRVIANDGFGVENAKVSIFIPLSNEDVENERISQVYPYFTPTDTDSRGIRYNLLPEIGKEFRVTINVPNGPNGSVQEPDLYYAAAENITSLGTFVQGAQWELVETGNRSSVWAKDAVSTTGPTVPVGTFPSKTKMLSNDTLLEVYEKYYKYTTRTNESGDYMIFGVPTGTRTVHMDVDLSDTGAASLTTDDYLNLGFPSSLFDGNKFKSSTNLDELPQIEAQNISVDVIPFWGNTEQCEIGITRLDFKLTKTITPSSILFFQAFMHDSDYHLERDCGCGGSGSGSSRCRELGKKKKMKTNVEALATAPGGEDIPARTYNDGNVIFQLPMYEERKITNEFGDLVDSNTDAGIPTAGTYCIFVTNPDENLTSFPSSEVLGTGMFIIPTLDQSNVRSPSFDYKGIKYRYDLVNRKRLLYTVGNKNGANSTNADESKITIRSRGNLGGRMPYPSNYRKDGEARFGTLLNNNLNGAGVAYGSLNFARLAFKDASNIVCSKVANYSSNNLLGVGGGGLVYYTYQYKAFGVLDVTDIINLFKPFGGSLPASSGSHGISTFQNAPNVPDPTYYEDGDGSIRDEAYPVISKLPDGTFLSNNSQAIFPSRLNSVEPVAGGIIRPSTLQWVSTNMYDPCYGFGPNVNTNAGCVTGPGLSLTGEKSNQLWYFFYFGLFEDDNALTNLRDNIGV